MYSNTKAFASEAKAQIAIDGLVKWGFPQSTIVKLTPASVSTAASGAPSKSPFVDAMAANEAAAEISIENMDDIEIQVFNEALGEGNTLVVVGSRFGESREAQRLMNRFGAVQFKALEYKVAPEWDEPEAAPFSTMLQLPTLSSRKPRASVFNGLIFGWLPQLTRSGFAMFGDGLKRNSPAPLSALIGKSTLSSNPAPLSAKLGKDTLINNPAPLSSKLGWKTLSADGGGEWKTSFGLPLLTKKS